MSTSTAPGDIAAALEVTVPDESRAARRASFAAADFAPVTGREEEWRFTPVDRLRGLVTDALAEGDAPALESVLPEGVTLEEVAAGDPRLGAVGVPDDRAAAQAWTLATGGVVLTVAAEAAPAEPARLNVVGRGGRSYAYLGVVAERHSRATIVVDHRGSGAVSANVEIALRDGAQLTVVSIQDWDDDAVHLSAHHAGVGRDAHLTHVVVTLGGDVVRVTPSVRFTGPGARADLFGLYFANGRRHQEHRLFVDHAVPHCTSNVLYKGALQGQGAHTVWVGDVLIRAAAEGTDTYELNRNLVLSEGARADSVPNLEIETGEIVGAGHASATGRFDDEQLFYLMARGIPQEQARRLVVRGFFAEMLQKIGVPDVAERLLARIEHDLAVEPVVSESAGEAVEA